MTVTRTARASSAPWATVFRVSAGRNVTADLAVNGIGYDNARPGDVLGRGATAVTFTRVADEGDCLVLTRGKTAYPVCAGQMLQLG